MATDGLPKNVADLLRERMHSLEAVETLLCVHGDRRPWAVSDIAERLRVDRDVVRGALGELVAEGFVTIEADGAARYISADPSKAAAVDALAEVYENARLDVLRAMTENAVTRIRNSAISRFADAFRLRKGRDDG